MVLLLVVRGLDTLTGPSRRIVIAGLCGFVPLLAFHNINQYKEARTLYVERYEERLHSPAEAPAHGAQQGPQQGRQQKPQ